MSHTPQRAAHIRHANRAGGFGFGGFNFSLPTFPGLGDDTTSTTSTTTTTSLTTSSAAPSTSVTVESVTTSSSSTTSSSAAPIPSPPAITTSSPISLPTTTYSGTALHQNLTKFVTQITSATASLAADASNSAAPATTNALVAPVVGGVAGGIVALAAVVFLITLLLRRRRPQEDAINFDPGAFRRSAMLMSDPPTHQDTIARGYNPSAPPSMVQRAPMYPNPINYSAYDQSNDGHSPTSGNPLVFEAPFSPITSPGVSSPVSAYDHSWGAPAPVLTRTGSGSSAHHEPAQHLAPPHRQNSLRAPESDYLDLERTSVTPFQAAQYVEISKHLNTDVPKGLDTPTVDTIVAEKMDADLPPLPSKDAQENPFGDDEEYAQEAALPMVQELSFPTPPSPVHTGRPMSRHSPRVDSTPPMLPEIVLHTRVSVASAYLSPAPGASEFPGSQTLVIKTGGPGPFGESPMGNRFPVTPSPLASSFQVSTPPPAGESGFPAAPEPAAKSQARPDAKKRQSVYTVYDDEDAYGGI
ncbi:hypothetical protein C8R46DRAFT_119321 [Mycena filopes]|nr:hypothetical protein C8R46DRAFT_119321 [Mycena filopes]